MRVAPMVAVSIALVSLLGIGASDQAVVAAGTQGVSPAHSKNVEDRYRNATGDQFKTLQSFLKGESDDILCFRIAHYQDVVRAAHRSHRLTNQEAEDFQDTLNAIAEKEAQWRALTGGKLPPFAKCSLHIAMDNFQQKLYRTFHDRKIATFDLPGRETMIELAIESAQADGRLSKSAADHLKNELKQQLQQQAGEMHSGKVSYGDDLLLSFDLDSIVTEMGAVLGPRPFARPDLVKMAAANEEALKKLSIGDLDNLRTVSEALHHPFPDLEKLQARKPKSDIDALNQAVQLEWLQSLLSLSEPGKPIHIDLEQQEQSVDKQIANLLERGHITPPEARRLLSNLAAVEEEQKAWQEGGKALDIKQQAQLALHVQRVAGRMEREQHHPNHFWAGLVPFHALLDERIEAGLKAGRLTDEQAKELKAQSNAIGKQYQNIKELDAKQALLVAVQMEQLNVRLHHALKDRHVAVPDLAALQHELEATVAEGVEQGRLYYGNELIDRLQHISELKEAYSKAPGGLDDRAKLAVAQATENAIAQLQSAIHQDRTLPCETSEMRLSELTHRINEASAMGVLDAERASQYKAAVDTIYGELQAARKEPGGLPPKQALAVANDIESLEDQLTDEMREAATTPKQLIPRVRELAMQVGLQLAQGRMSLSEASELISELDNTSERLVAAAASAGGLSLGEGLRLAYDLDCIAAKMESSISDEPVIAVDVSGRASQLDGRLANALAAGKLNVATAERLQNRLTAILKQREDFIKNYGGLTYPEMVALSIEMNRLQTNLDVTLAQCKPLPANDLDSRRAQLEKTVKAAVASGKLNLHEGQALVDEFDRLAASEASFRQSGEGLTAAEALTLMEELDGLEAKVHTAVKGELSLQKSR